MTSGIARGRVRTTATAKAHKIAVILQLMVDRDMHVPSVCSVFFFILDTHVISNCTTPAETRYMLTSIT